MGQRRGEYPTEPAAGLWEKGERLSGAPYLVIETNEREPQVAQNVTRVSVTRDGRSA